MVSVVVLQKFLNASLLDLTLDGTIDGLFIYVLIPLSDCVCNFGPQGMANFIIFRLFGFFYGCFLLSLYKNERDFFFSY